MKTKVMHLIGSLRIGGAETLITDYALNINKNKFEITIVTLMGRYNTINEKKLDDNGIKVIYLGEHVIFPKAKNFLEKSINKVHKLFLMNKLSKQEEFDIVHTHLNVNEYILPMRIKSKDVKLFHTIHAELKTALGKHRLKERLVLKFLIKYKNMIPIALHSRMKKEIELLFNINNCELIPNAIELERFSEKNNDKKEMLKSLKLDENTFIMGHIGRFAKVKNHEFLIDLLEYIKKRQPKVHLLLIGSGYLEKQIKNQVYTNELSKNVSFLGNRTDIPELLNIMDVFIFPSFREGFGNVLIEAQAAGVKCVISDTIPDETHITNLVTALSLEDSLETWYKAIMNTSKTQSDKSQIEKHDIINIIKEIEKLYLS